MMWLLRLVGGKIKLYAFAVFAFIVTWFIIAFKWRGRKIKKQKQQIKGHEANKEIADADREGIKESRVYDDKVEDMTDDEALNEANSDTDD